MSRARKAIPKAERAAAAAAPAPATVAKPKRPQSLADYLRRQRSLADISLRKIIERSGIPAPCCASSRAGCRTEPDAAAIAGRGAAATADALPQAGVLTRATSRSRDGARGAPRPESPNASARSVEVYKAWAAPTEPQE